MGKQKLRKVVYCDGHVGMLTQKQFKAYQKGVKRREAEFFERLKRDREEMADFFGPDFAASHLK